IRSLFATKAGGHQLRAGARHGCDMIIYAQERSMPDAPYLRNPILVTRSYLTPASDARHFKGRLTYDFLFACVA
ncbi:MAG: hypothetical protein IKG21_10560, partial [Atopobiaceae bacterium]|nr:hypothetical protein [Atopobiaceae bacterium]